MILSCLYSSCDFVLQKDNVSNQREHVVHLLANEQSRLRIPEEPEPVCFTSCIPVIFLELEFNVVLCSDKCKLKSSYGFCYVDKVKV